MSTKDITWSVSAAPAGLKLLSARLDNTRKKLIVAIQNSGGSMIDLTGASATIKIQTSKYVKITDALESIVVDSGLSGKVLAGGKHTIGKEDLGGMQNNLLYGTNYKITVSITPKSGTPLQATESTQTL